MQVTTICFLDKDNSFLLTILPSVMVEQGSNIRVSNIENVMISRGLSDYKPQCCVFKDSNLRAHSVFLTLCGPVPVGI